MAKMIATRVGTEPGTSRSLALPEALVP
jgi:hypothetical protein